MSAERLPTLTELGPLSDRELRIHALGYNAGRDDGFDRGFDAGVLTVIDAESATVAQPRQRHLRLVAS